MRKTNSRFRAFLPVICILIITLSVQSVFAASLNFGTDGGPTTGGAYFLYSDMPESLYDSVIPGSGIYDVEKTVTPNMKYTCETYHFNPSNQSYSKRVGFALINTSTSAQTVTLHKYGSQVNSTNGCEASAIANRNWGNSSSSTITVPAATSSSSPGVYPIYANINSGEKCTVKITFSTASSSIKVRSFMAKSTAAFSAIPSFPKATETTEQTLSGFWPRDSRFININASTNSSFYLAAWQNTNTNEYDSGSDTLGIQPSNPNKYNYYGNVYDVQLSNAAGKRIKITPNLQSTNANFADIVLWTSSNGWYTTGLKYRNDPTPYWYMAVPSDQHFKFILAGGNFANVKFEIVD